MLFRSERAAAQILRDKGILQLHSLGGAYKLTDYGRELCLDTNELEEVLGPPPPPTLNFNHTNIGSINGNAQVGNHNVQNNSLAINNIQQLVQEINDDPDVDPEKKSRWVETLVNVATGIGGAAAGAAVSKVIGG